MESEGAIAVGIGSLSSSAQVSTVVPNNGLTRDVGPPDYSMHLDLLMGPSQPCHNDEACVGVLFRV